MHYPCSKIAWTMPNLNMTEVEKNRVSELIAVRSRCDFGVVEAGFVVLSLFFSGNWAGCGRYSHNCGK